MEKDVVKARAELARATIVIAIIFVIGGVATAVRGWLFTLAGQRLVARVRSMVWKFCKIHSEINVRRFLLLF